ncbi:hypothetical protein AB1Y20_016140 [Prymnesium parvum]|uniref:tRNA-intron lyase n=1 Tax=Prymnesium parvum TaxID=97485 RepID=A0AB34JZY3_PRYPA
MEDGERWAEADGEGGEYADGKRELVEEHERMQGDTREKGEEAEREEKLAQSGTSAEDARIARDDGVAAEFTGSSVVVRESRAIARLHEWSRGGYGELVPSDARSAVRVLRLSTLEAYFLAFEEQRLLLRRARPLFLSSHMSSEDCWPMSSEDCWAAFCALSASFPQRYAAYRSLRAAGWVVRTGVPYGTDFALYEPAAEPSAHALLGAIVAEALEPGERTWCWLQLHARLCHAVSKGLLLCWLEQATEAQPSLDEHAAGRRVDTPASQAASGPSWLSTVRTRTLQVGQLRPARRLIPHQAGARTADAGVVVVVRQGACSSFAMR